MVGRGFAPLNEYVRSARGGIFVELELELARYDDLESHGRSCRRVMIINIVDQLQVGFVGRVRRRVSVGEVRCRCSPYMCSRICRGTPTKPPGEGCQGLGIPRSLALLGRYRRQLSSTSGADHH